MAPFDIRRIPPEDLDALSSIRDIAFQDSSDLSNPEIREHHLRYLPFRWGCYEANELISTASWVPFHMYFAGKEVEIGGLASVSTALQHRRKGSVQALLKFGLEDLKARSVGWSLEYPFDTRFYHRYGWDTVDNGAFFEVPTQRLHQSGHVTSMRRANPQNPEDLHSIKSIHATWASRYNLTLARTSSARETWTELLEGVFYDKRPRFTFLGEHAYCVLHIKREQGGVERAYISDWAYDAPEGRSALLGFLGNFAGQFETVRIQLPSDEPLTHEWSNFQIPHPHPLHARIIDVPSALSGMEAPEGLSLVIQVEDDFCPWNHDTFEISCAGGETWVAPTSQDPQCRLDIRALARLVTGSMSARAALHTGMAHGDLATLSTLARLTQRPSFASLSDYF